MSMLAASLAGSAIIVLVAAPGEPPIAERDVPDAAKAAVIRRLDQDVLPNFRRIVVQLSERMPGYGGCGGGAGQSADAGQLERFFVVIPGHLALPDRGPQPPFA